MPSVHVVPPSDRRLDLIEIQEGGGEATMPRQNSPDADYTTHYETNFYHSFWKYKERYYFQYCQVTHSKHKDQQLKL